MGLSNAIPRAEHENMLTQIGDKFALRVDASTEGATERLLKKGDHEGEPVYEMYYSSLTGMLVGGEIKKTGYGLRAGLRVDDGKDVYLVDFGVSDKQFKSVVSRFPNLDLTQPFTISLKVSKTKKTSKGKPVINLFVNQNGNDIDDYYVHWEKNGAGGFRAICLNGIPPVEKDEYGVFDFSGQDKFLLGKFKEFVETDHPTTPVSTSQVVPEEVLGDDPTLSTGGKQEAAQTPTDDTEDGLPF